MKTVIQCEGVKKSYRGLTVVENLNLAIQGQEFVALLGPSGCGKTTTLNLIAGFESLEEGVVQLLGQAVSTKDFHLPAERRGIGMVFQDFALFPHLSLAENVGFGLKGPKKGARVWEMLKLVGLEAHANQLPHQLSGGQQQRVAVARALAPRPQVVLLDEPFSNLDTRLRVELRQELKAILKQEGVTVVLVTHDQEEAFSFADRIVMMHGGRILQKGTPKEIYQHPATPWAAGFVGAANFLPAAFVKEHLLRQVQGRAERLDDCSEACQVMVRPEEIELTPGEDALITQVEFTGSGQRVALQLWEGREIHALVNSRLELRVGEKTGLLIHDYQCYDGSSGL